MSITDAEYARTIQRFVGMVECPHCWHRAALTDLVWIAAHESLRGDPIAGPHALLRFRPSRFTPTGAALDLQGQPCERLACPRCHLPLSRILLESKPLIFSMIGVPASGKSYLLASMAWELRQKLPTRFQLAFTDTDPESNLIVSEYERTLFLSGDDHDWVYLDKTQVEGDLYDRVRLGDQSVSLPHPFLFTFRPQRSHPKAAKADELTRVLCFYDNAGEHFQPGMDSAVTPATQHVARSRVLFFLFGPSQDPRFRQRCRAISDDPQLASSQSVERQETVLTEALVRLRTYAQLGPQQQIEKPLIVLVAKSDIWGPLIDEDITSDPYLPGPAGQPDRVDAARIQRVSGKLRALLLEVAPELVSVAEDACTDVTYMPVSALGGPPQRQTLAEGRELLVVRPDDIKPRWVTVPIVYAFAKWSRGLIELATPEDAGGA
jgi:hypothetical protein